MTPRLHNCNKIRHTGRGALRRYNAKDGTFKGSFMAYALEGGKLRKVKMGVSGVLIDGVGYGTATIKNAGSVAVTIE